MKGKFLAISVAVTLVMLVVAPAWADDQLNVYQMIYEDASSAPAVLTIFADPCWKISGNNMATLDHQIDYRDAAGNFATVTVIADPCWTVKTHRTDTSHAGLPKPAAGSKL
ncbi:MAG: hypothetical protein BA861_03280 [Desulfobacterales bacterium S3730MH5]|nr:MAG: hypothetical protein BA861_03280 [Desulfobacterales bacterium S3730MH5]